MRKQCERIKTFSHTLTRVLLNINIPDSNRQGQYVYNM